MNFYFALRDSHNNLGFSEREIITKGDTLICHANRFFLLSEREIIKREEYDLYLKYFSILSKRHGRRQYVKKDSALFIENNFHVDSLSQYFSRKDFAPLDYFHPETNSLDFANGSCLNKKKYLTFKQSEYFINDTT